MDNNRKMNVQEDIPAHFRAGFLAREKNYTLKELEYFYSLSDTHSLKEAARDLVLNKRKEFYQLWLKESNMSHFNDERDQNEKTAIRADIEHINKQWQLLIDKINNLLK